jgi:transposase
MHGVQDTEELTWSHLITFQYPTHVHAREPLIKCDVHGKKTVEYAMDKKGIGFTPHFEALNVRQAKICQIFLSHVLSA